MSLQAWRSVSGRLDRPTRVLISLVVFIASAVAVGASIVLSSKFAGEMVAILFLGAMGITGLLASAFIAAPHSRYGRWLDHFVTRLRTVRTAVFVALSLWAISFILMTLVR